tara:strand:- start:1091 stop:2713 length:1623 start_codon:yes stop_codon:yes gene_type:complete
MELLLKGKVQKLGTTFGVIKSDDYNELHFFILSDIIDNEKTKIKLGDNVSFGLKTNKARGSNAVKIKILSNENTKIHSDDNLQKGITNKFPIEEMLKTQSPNISIKAFQNFITEDFILLNTDNEDLNNLIKMVVRDNVITDIEKAFLKEKTLELNLSADLIKKANEYLFSNNPFFDNILAIIFKDGVIKENELEFLFEKSKENNFSESFINKRFWQYYFKLHLNNLLEFKNIQKIIKLWHLSKILELDLVLTNDWIIMQLNILKSTKIENSIHRVLNKFEKIIFPLLENKYNLTSIDSEKLYGFFSLDYGEKDNNISVLEHRKENPFVYNNKYTKENIYKFFNVPKEQQKGKWHNGYCEHNNDWFIFTNIGQTGHGFSKENEFDYNNSFDQYGDLNWEAINNSKISWESIQKLKSSTPYIFIRKPETDKNYWEYLGIGHCLFTLDTTPVKFKWKILLEKTPIKEKKTLNKISSFKNEKTLKQWNKNIVPEKYKSKIITLINNDEIFDASQEYLNFAYENGQKNLSKIMDEFEKIIENLGK